MFGTELLRKALQLKTEEVKEKWRRLHNEELYLLLLLNLLFRLTPVLPEFRARELH
jgi:hypothetical protein